MTETETPSAAPEQAVLGKAMSAVLCAETDEAEYPDFLHFSLIYLDEDNIPELAVSQGNAHVSGVRLYAWNGEEYQRLRTDDLEEWDEFGSWGSVVYGEKSGLVWDGYTGSGIMADYILLLSDGVLKRTATFYTDEGFGPLEDMPDWQPVYEVNDEEVTREVYEAERERVTGGRPLRYTGSDGAEITDDTLAKLEAGELEEFFISTPVTD